MILSFTIANFDGEDNIWTLLVYQLTAEEQKKLLKSVNL